MNTFESEFEKELKSFNKRDFHIILEKYNDFKEEAKQNNVDLSTFVSMLNVYQLHKISQKIESISNIQEGIVTGIGNIGKAIISKKFPEQS